MKPNSLVKITELENRINDLEEKITEFTSIQLGLIDQFDKQANINDKVGELIEKQSISTDNLANIVRALYITTFDGNTEDPIYQKNLELMKQWIKSLDIDPDLL